MLFRDVSFVKSLQPQLSLTCLDSGGDMSYMPVIVLESDQVVQVIINTLWHFLHFLHLCCQIIVDSSKYSWERSGIWPSNQACTVTAVSSRSGTYI